MVGLAVAVLTALDITLRKKSPDIGLRFGSEPARIIFGSGEIMRTGAMYYITTA